MQAEYTFIKLVANFKSEVISYQKNPDFLTLLKNFYALALLSQHSSMKQMAGPEEQTFLSWVGGVVDRVGGAGGSSGPCLPTHPLSSFLLTTEFSTLQWWVWALRGVGQSALPSCSLCPQESQLPLPVKGTEPTALGSFLANVHSLCGPSFSPCPRLLI